VRASKGTLGLDGTLGSCVWSLAGSDKNDTDGIVDGHAYSLIAVKKNVCGQHDLMMFRNPHGKTEFKGEWHDGSVEWQQNPTAAQELNYRSDPNDGLFWISKKDAFRYFQTFSPIPSKPAIGACEAVPRSLACYAHGNDGRSLLRLSVQVLRPLQDNVRHGGKGGRDERRGCALTAAKS